MHGICTEFTAEGERVRKGCREGEGEGRTGGGEEHDVRTPDDREQAREQRKEVASGQDGVAEGGLDAPVGFRFPLRTKRREKQREGKQRRRQG